jgi:putative ABC transport system permease protein
MAHLTSDIRFALRGLTKRPAQSLLVILTLAVGLAANAVIFGALDALLLRPLEFPNLPRLVRLWETTPGTPDYERGNVAPGNLHDWAESGMFEKVVAMEWWNANLRGREVPERVQGFRVSPVFFETLGVAPQRGRGFLPEEGREGQHLQAILGHELWHRGFGGDPEIVGQSVTLDGAAYTVVGIAPEGFSFPMGAELWAPLVVPAPGAASRKDHFLNVFAMLAPGRTVEEARAALEVVAKRLQLDHPTTNTSRGIVVTSMSRGFEDAGLRPIMGLWQVAAALVLLIACVNVANLMLARGAERQRELALRLALGADRGRVIRQLLTEGLVVASLGIAAALPLCALASREMRRHMPAEIARFVPGWANIGLDERTIAFTAVLGLLATLLFAAVPALRASRPGLTEALREGGRSATAGTTRQRGRNALVVTQVAFALTLVVVAGLAMKSVHGMIEGPQGFDVERLLTFQVTLPEGRYGDEGVRRAFARDVAARLSELPGVSQVAHANVLPGRGNNSHRPIQVEGEPPFDPSDPPRAQYRTISPSYFDTLRQPVVAGRALDARDDEHAVPVAVVSRSFAERFWPGRDPLGRRFRTGGEDTPWITVVGVCGDVIHHWFSSRNRPAFYRSYAQDPRFDIAYAVRTTDDPEAVASAARLAISSVDPYQPAYDVRSMVRSIRMSTIGLQYVAGIMTVFGGLAVVLAVSGIYGVMSYRVSLRTQEIGVRVALGASSHDVLKLTMGQALWLTGLGLLLGGGLGLAGARALSAALMGVVAFDSATFALFTALLALAALLAAYVPARRALSVDPALALRAE